LFDRISGLYGIGILATLAELAGVLVLLGVLKIGKENAGWDQLE